MKHWKIPADRETVDLSSLMPRQVGLFYLFLVAICHQTSPRGRKALEGVVAGVPRKGWDFLLHSFLRAVAADPSLIEVKTWRGFDVLRIRGLFSSDLTEPDQRARLIRDLGEVMQANGWETADMIHKEAAGHILDREPSLVSLLSRFRAYDDPVRKKTFYFLSLMRNHGIWQYVDLENLGAPVDYHEVRGHLRLGTVQIHSSTLRNKIEKFQPVDPEEDIAIRQATFDAIQAIAGQVGRTPSELHYLFWNVFRSNCVREFPNCFGTRPSPLPEPYRQLSPDVVDNACPFAGKCPSAGRHRPPCEHVFDTDYY
ncbi:MAG: hypothetical protein SFU86_10015 [Pirellulaceae bacterium]|nr:hypothetical protein [Pirellulaceae bacterium]